jgi:beta-lactamase class A
MTVATLANLMISISDNTATDALVEHLGRAAIEAVTSRNTPFPKTSDIFKLNGGDAETRAAWLAADAGGRRAILDRLAAEPLPTGESADAAGIAAEWYLTATELCALLDEVADHPAFTINAGPARGIDAASVAFKGGSDNGVLNFSTRLVDRDGEVHCVVATWNDDAALSQTQLLAPYRGILGFLAQDEAETTP